MKKLIALTVMGIAMFSFLHAQTFKTFKDDFESYTVGDWLAQTSPIWTSWSGTPATTGDDVKVANTDAYSGTKSLYFSPGPGTEDIVLPFGGKHTRGQFNFTMQMKVPSGKSAYFNFQAETTPGVTWAVEVSFQTNGNVTFSNTTSGTMMTTDFPFGKWFEMRVYVQLSTNTWHVYIDDEYKGYFANSINSIASLDLYPIDGNSSFWVDDVAFTYVPPSPNNAGVRSLTAPFVPLNCGNHTVKVNVVNNGNNKLDSVRVYWTLDGVAQTPVFVTTTIDTPASSAGNALQVTLSNSVGFGTTLRKIKAWTAFPNGAADTVNFDDTLKTSLKATISGISTTQGSPFNGRMGAGTAAAPDTVCVGDTVTYGISPPTGFSNADFGTGWGITNLKIQRGTGIPPVDTMTFLPSTNANARIRFVPDTSEAGETFKMETTVQVGTMGCDSIITRYVYVAPVATPGFTTSDVCDREVVVFTNSSSGGAGQGTLIYNWDFDNNTSSTTENPLRVYASPGTYNVKLEVTNGLGCKSSVVKPVTVYPKPTADFTAVNECAGDSIHFTNASSITSGTINSYSWDFGGGNTSADKNPAHRFDSAGTFNVTLVATGDHNCKGQITKQVEAFEVPEADFSVTNACVYNAVAFFDATKYKGSGLTYAWDFGDGNTSSVRSPSHKYAAAGSYVAKLVAISPQGCADSITKPVEVYPEPVANFSFANQCHGAMTMFTDASTVSSGSISGYVWKFGDGNNSATRNPSHQYANTGQFSVSLIVNSANACVDTVIKTVDIHEIPVADFTFNNRCLGEVTMLTNQSTINSGTLSYKWKLGDGSTSTDMDPITTYSTFGTFDVQLVATSDMGCSDTITQSVQIFPLPVADFKVNFVCLGEPTIFTNSSTSLSDTMLYNWELGDGATSVDKIPAYTYGSDGSFDIELKVRTENGCMDSITMTAQVYPLPDPTFTRAHLGNGLYQFTPTITGLTGYNWNFGDGASSTDASPQHKYADFGTYKVILTTMSNKGCEASSNEDLEYATGIKERPDASFISVYPNPYKESTHIVYQLEKPAKVMIEVYTMEGKLVQRLANETQTAGEHSYTFSGKESGLGSGSFFIRFAIDGETYMKQVVKMK